MENEETPNISIDYSEIIQNNFVIQSYVNGMSRFLILWITKAKQPIHGYGILKELDKFFETLINEKSLKKSNPSKIYPVLNKMEDLNLIKSHFEMKGNRKVKFYEITDEGKYVLDYLYTRFDYIHGNKQWTELFNDMNKSWIF